MRKINTLRFGEIEVEDSAIIKFENGIPAFEDEHEFLVVPFDKESPYVFMQSATTPELAFLMTTPFLFFPDYEFTLDDVVVDNLGIKNPDDMFVYSLLTIPGGNIQKITANLLAPVVICKSTMKAKQVVLEKTQYQTKHQLFKEEEK